MQVVSESHIYTDPVSEAICPKCGEALSVVGLPAFTNVECPKCSHEFQVPARFGPFLLIELLGAGGMGGVYRAKDEALNREVAIKVMLQSLGDDIDFVETFQREAQAAAKLNNPHIAQIYSFGQQYGQPYIVMELVSGGSLEQMMVERDGVEPASAIMIGAQIAEGLNEAADAGLVHGDVKPENILFDDDGNAKLVDFGLVALSSSNDNEVWGTPFYIAPEKVRRQKSDFRADIYSLGATLYHAIANKPPFDGADATAVVKARFEAPPKPLSELTGREIPADVEALIQRMLENDPAKRYPTYGSLLGDMRRFLSKAGPVSLKKNSRRIMIKGKQAVKFDRHSTQRTVTGQITADGAISTATADDEDSVQAQGCRKMIVAAVLLVIGLVVLGTGIVFAHKYRQKKNEQRKTSVLLDNQQKVIDAGLKAVEVAGRNAEKFKAFYPDALRYAEEAANVAVTVLGEDARARMTPPEPEMKFVEDAQPADSSNQQAEAASPATPAKSDATNKVGRIVIEQPDGQVPRDDDHPVVKTVYAMFMEAYSVKKAGFIADQVVAELAAMQQNLVDIKENQGAGDTQRDIYKKMTDLYEVMKNKVSGMAYLPELQSVPNVVANLKVSRDSVMTELETLEAQRRLEKAEQERLARKAAEEARQKALREAEEKKISNDKKRVAEVEAECVDSIVNFRFSTAVRSLNSLNNELESDEGRAALRVAVDRVMRIEEFLKYIVEKSKGFKSSKGWTITEADERWLVVGRTKVLWKDFYTEQYTEAAELIAVNVTNPEIKASMRIREYTRLLTNTSLFLSVFYPEREAAQRFARKLANDAVELFEIDAVTVKKLLPQYFE